MRLHDKERAQRILEQLSEADRLFLQTAFELDKREALARLQWQWERWADVVQLQQQRRPVRDDRDFLDRAADFFDIFGD